MIASSFYVVARIRALRFAEGMDTAFHAVPVASLASALGVWLARTKVDRSFARQTAAGLFVCMAIAMVVPLWWLLEPSSVLRSSWGTAVCLLTPCAVVVGALWMVMLRAPLEDASSDGHHVGRILAATSLGIAAGTLFAHFLPGYLGTHGPLRIALAFAAISAAVWVLLARHRLRHATAVLALIAFGGAIAYKPTPPPGTWRSRLGDLHAGPTKTAMIEVESLAPFAPLRDREALSEQLGILEGPPRIFWRGPMSRDQELQLRRAITQPKGRKAIEALLGRVGRSLRVLSDSGRERAVLDVLDPTWTSGDLDAFVLQLGIRGLRDAKKGRVLVSTDGFSPVVWPIASRAPRRGATTVLVSEASFEEAFRNGVSWSTPPTVDLVRDDIRSYLRRRRLDQTFGWIHIDTRPGRSVRWHTTTDEAARSMGEALCDGGFVSIVLYDAPRSRKVLSPVVASLSAHFSHIQIYALRRRHDTSPRQRDTPTHNRVVPLVIFAGTRPLKLDVVHDEAQRPIRFTEFGQLYMEALRQQAGDRILRDAYAPIQPEHVWTDVR